jgi:hypothetical protein
MDGGTPEQQTHWVNKKHIVHEEDIISRIPSVVIGADTILRDNPISYPVNDGKEGLREIPAVTVTISMPVPVRGTENVRDSEESASTK